jgi:hypothetical protein
MRVYLQGANGDANDKGAAKDAAAAVVAADDLAVSIC